MATFTCLNSGENAENIRFWRSVPKDVDPEYHEREPELVVGPGRPRTLTAKEENTIDTDVYPKVGLSIQQLIAVCRAHRTATKLCLNHFTDWI